MLIIDRSVITDGGAALLNSGDPINITSVKTGSGTYTSSEDIKSRTALKSTQYSYTPSSVSVDGATRSIDALLSNYDPDTETAIVTSDYTLTEVGLFATVNGADVLFAIGISYDGSEVPAFTGQNKSEIIVNWDMAVSGTDAITITATGAPALATDLNAHVNSEAYSASGVHGLRVVLDDTDLVLQAYVNGDWEEVSGGGPKTGTITLSSDTVTVDNVTSTATVTFTTNSDGTPSVSSSDDNVATASLSGTTVTITGVTNGSATITVSIPATAKYTAVSATISVTSSVIPIPELVIGNTYFFGGFYWTAAEDLGNNTVCMQSQGMTAGTWPGYKLTTDYTGTKSYGNVDTAYGSDIDGDNIANYDDVTSAWYSKYSAVEKTGQAYGSGLFLVSNTKCGTTTSGTQGSGNYWSALKTASINNGPTSFLGTVNTSGGGTFAWNVASTGAVQSAGSQATAYNVAPAFNLDLTKVKLVDGDHIMLPTEEMPTLKTFATATDAEIAAMVQASEKGIIDLYEDAGWRVGQEHQISLSAIAASGTYDGVSWTVGEAQGAQNGTLVLMHHKPVSTTDANAYKLVTATECGHKIPSFVIGLKNCMETAGYINGTRTNAGSWKACARRNWCNGGFREAIPSSLRQVFKQFNVITAKEYNSSEIEITNDYFSLPACKEVFGTASFSTTNEAGALMQFDYYVDSSTHVKYIGDTATKSFWFERSPRIQYNEYWCALTDNGAEYATYADDPETFLRISPFGVIA